MTSTKFAGLTANVTDTFRMPIISPVTDKPLVDRDGQAAFIELLSADSDVGRAIDREHQEALAQRAMRGALRAPIDGQNQAVAKLAALTRGWHLVDLDGNALDVPFSRDNAIELYSNPGMAWLYRQATVAAFEVANFMRPSSNAS